MLLQWLPFGIVRHLIHLVYDGFCQPILLLLKLPWLFRSFLCVQCQRVAIARALINDPAIILADEPTGNLDSKTSHEIMNILGKIHNDGNTVVLVTHEEDIASFAHRVVRLRDGVIETDKLNAHPSLISQPA